MPHMRSWTAFLRRRKRSIEKGFVKADESGYKRTRWSGASAGDKRKAAKGGAKSAGDERKAAKGGAKSSWE
eukprot:11046848-Karenia_brevis.AAC.1